MAVHVTPVAAQVQVLQSRLKVSPTAYVCPPSMQPCGAASEVDIAPPVTVGLPPEPGYPPEPPLPPIVPPVAPSVGFVLPVFIPLLEQEVVKSEE
jgi:hypothetical protein